MDSKSGSCYLLVLNSLQYVSLPIFPSSILLARTAISVFLSLPPCKLITLSPLPRLTSPSALRVPTCPSFRLFSWLNVMGLNSQVIVFKMEAFCFRFRHWEAFVWLRVRMFSLSIMSSAVRDMMPQILSDIILETWLISLKSMVLFACLKLYMFFGALLNLSHR